MKISGHRSRNVFERYNVVDESDLWEAIQRMQQPRLAVGHETTSAVEG